MRSERFGQLNIKKINGTTVQTATDLLAAEEPLEIALSYSTENKVITKTISVTMRTPGNDTALAAGFLFTEGIINDPAAIEEALSHEENKITIALTPGTIPMLQGAERNFYTTSSCGVCGKSSIEAIKTVSAFNDLESDITINASALFSYPTKLRQHQKVFEQTGGLHASAFFDREGNIVLMQEDVGRHNALDKLIGEALTLNQLPLDSGVLLLSGRASFELIQKAAMAGIKIVAAIGAPSTLAARLADEAGITLAGFLKNDSGNIYTHAERITYNS